MSTAYTGAEWAALDIKPPGHAMEKRDGSIIVLDEMDTAGPARAVLSLLPQRDDPELVDRNDLYHLIDDVAVEASMSGVPWIITDLLYYRGAFLVAGAPKIGKSTLLADVIRARAQGEVWVGLNVAQGPTLLLTEEGPLPTAWRWHRASGMSVMFRYEALNRWSDERKSAVTPGMPKDIVDESWSFAAWTLRMVRRWVEGQRNPLVIVDTLAVWGGMEDENDASEATTAISQWTRFAQDTGACVILVHHMRKSGGSNGEGIRGSSALLGTADGSWEVGRMSDKATDTRRRISVLSRMAFPSEMILEYDPKTGAYAVSDNGPDLGEMEAWLTVLHATGTGEGRTIRDLEGLWQCARSTVYKRIESLSNAGRLHREEAKRGAYTSWHYWSVPPVDGGRPRHDEADEDVD